MRSPLNQAKPQQASGLNHACAHAYMSNLATSAIALEAAMTTKRKTTTGEGASRPDLEGLKTKSKRLVSHTPTAQHHQASSTAKGARTHIHRDVAGVDATRTQHTSHSQHSASQPLSACATNLLLRQSLLQCRKYTPAEGVGSLCATHTHSQTQQQPQQTQQLPGVGLELTMQSASATQHMPSLNSLLAWWHG